MDNNSTVYKIIISVLVFAMVVIAVYYFYLRFSASPKILPSVEQNTSQDVSSEDTIFLVAPTGEVSDLLNAVTVYAETEKNEYEKEINNVNTDILTAEAFDLATSKDEEGI